MSRVKKGRYIRCKDGTCIRGKEREVSAGQGRRRVSVVRREAKLTYLW